jgi:hypothetical protein
MNIKINCVKPRFNLLSTSSPVLGIQELAKAYFVTSSSQNSQSSEFEIELRTGPVCVITIEIVGATLEEACRK